MFQIDALEKLANQVNDWDAQWWPFLFLRPSTDARLTSGRVALLAVLFGVFVGTLGNVVLALCGRAVSPLVLPIAATVGCFLLFRSTFAYFWNRRAERLQRALSLRGRYGRR